MGSDVDRLGADVVTTAWMRGAMVAKRVLIVRGTDTRSPDSLPEVLWPLGTGSGSMAVRLKRNECSSERKIRSAAFATVSVEWQG